MVNKDVYIDLAHRLYNSLLLPHKPWCYGDSLKLISHARSCAMCDFV